MHKCSLNLKKKMVSEFLKEERTTAIFIVFSKTHGKNLNNLA